MNVAALGTDVTESRRIGPVKVEEGGRRGVQLRLALVETRNDIEDRTLKQVTRSQLSG